MRISLLAILLSLCTCSIHAQPVDIHYYTIGEGEPLLMINGGPGWSSSHMKPVAEKISGMGYQVILFDQRGTGKSDVKITPETITFELMIEDIERIRKEMGISSFVVYGHSFGGMLAMGYASTYPDRVNKLVLSAPGGCDLSFLDYYQTNLNYALTEKEKQAVQKWSNPEMMKKDPDSVSYHLIKNTISSFLFNKSLADTIMAAVDTKTWNMQTGNLVWQDLVKSNYDLKPKLHNILAPTLIIQGRQDALGQVNPITISQLIPNAELTFLEKSAHLMWLDRPEAYYEAIGQFLDRSISYTSLEPGKAKQLLLRMKGENAIESRVLNEEGEYQQAQGEATFRERYGGVEESFSLELNGRTISGTAFIRYSGKYNRFELVQADEAAGSFLLLNGYLESASGKLVFKPVKRYSQWGSTGTLDLRWEYEFYDDGSFKKIMKIPAQDGSWKIQSDYHYKSK